MDIQNLWPTPVAQIDYDGSLPDLNEALTEEIIGGFRQSDNFWTRSSSVVQELRRFTNEAMTSYALAVGFTQGIALGRGWSHVNRHLEGVTPHCHGNASIAAVYYVKAADRSGDLLLHDPRGATSWVHGKEPGMHGGTRNGRIFHRIVPHPGLLVIFPGYVVHSVEINRTDQPRICVATNMTAGY